MKIFEGIIVSTGMKNTAVVEIYRRTPHTLYKKLIKRSKKFKVDNGGFEDAVVGTTVRIVETRPISKDKYFKIIEIVGSKQIKDKKSNLKSKEPVEAKKEVTIRTRKTKTVKKTKGETNS